jgi:AmpD protein
MLNIQSKPLKHFNDRPADTAIDTIIIHSLYAKDAKEQMSALACHSILDTCEVSAHYLISREGEVWRLVDEAKRAWHAGVSKMPLPDDSREGVNHFSIGIELIATEESGFTPEQYESLALLIFDISSRQPIRNVLGHEHIAPGRKVDPGPNFDWPRLRALLEGNEQTRGKVNFPV